MPRRGALALLCMAQVLEVLGVTVVVVALPSIAADLGATGAEREWVVSAYALCFGGLLLVAGRTADAFGHRRQFAAGLVGFAVASLACGLATSPGVLLGARAVQGIAAAAVVPAALALLSATFPSGAARERAFGWWTAAAAGGGAAGFLVGGLVTAALGWRWIFLLNVPFAVLAAVLAPRMLPEGAAGSARVAPLATLGAAARLVRNSAVARASAVAAVLTATTGGAAVLVTTALQDDRGLGATATGLAFLPFSLAVAGVSVLGPRVTARAGRRAAIAAGLLVVGAGLALFALSDAVAVTVAGLTISGAGLGLASVAATALGMDGAPASDEGLAAGLLNTATQLGTAVGVAAFGALAAATSAQAAWLAAAALAALTAPVVAARGRRAPASPAAARAGARR